MRNRHLQTVWSALFRRNPKVATSWEVVETPDGDFLDLEWLPRREGAPGVIVVHGLEGSSSATYVRGVLARVAERGWNGVAINHRSCGPSPHRGQRTYHSGFTDDLRFLVDRTTGRLGLVGFSLGGNMVVKYLGEGPSPRVVAAVAISTPFDLARCAEALDGPGFWPWVYRARFLRTLKAKAVRSARRFPNGIDVSKVRQAKTFREFDEHVTARLFGFEGALDYWNRASSGPFLEKVATPLLAINALDDPMIPAASLPLDALGKNPHVTTRFTPNGGHVGFVEGSLFAREYAAERMAMEFLASHL